MIYNPESAIFVLLGNFITSCYSSNWAWQDLLRQPLQFSGSFQKRKFLVFTIPHWLPFNDAILKVPGIGIESKLKDLFLGGQLQKHTESENVLIVDAESLLTQSAGPLSASLVYWPMFRFIIEPMSYSSEIRPPEYVLHSLDYIMRLSGARVDLDVGRMTLKTSSFTLQVGGSNTFDSLTVIEANGFSEWNLSEKTIRLSVSRLGIFHPALERMIESGVSLERCRIRRVDRTLELRYVG